MRPARACFLYYLSVYVNPFKERFLGRHGEAMGASPESGCKSRDFKTKKQGNAKEMCEKSNLFMFFQPLSTSERGFHIIIYSDIRQSKITLRLLHP